MKVKELVLSALETPSKDFCQVTRGALFPLSQSTVTVGLEQDEVSCRFQSIGKERYPDWKLRYELRWRLSTVQIRKLTDERSDA